MNKFITNYTADKNGNKTTVLGKNDFDTVTEFTEYKESVQSYFNTLAHFKKVNALHKTQELNNSLRAVLVASKQLSPSEVNAVMPFNIHAFLIGTTKTTAKGYTDAGKDAVNTAKELIEQLETAQVVDNGFVVNGVILSADAHAKELELAKTALAELKNTAIYNATSIKQTSVNTFRKRFELVVGSCLADNGKLLRDFEEVTAIQLGKKWRTFKDNFEKFALDMDVFWDCVAKFYHDHDKKAESVVKGMIADAKKAVKDAEKAVAETEKAEESKTTFTREELKNMVVAELKKLASDNNISVPNKAKKSDLVDLLEKAVA